MGLPRTNENELDSLKKRFSDDVLKFELSGPEYHHLSVVDVPGLFHRAYTAPRLLKQLHS